MALASACTSDPLKTTTPEPAVATSSTDAPQITTDVPTTTSTTVWPTDRADVREAREKFDLIVFFDATATAAETKPVFEQLDPLSSQLIWVSQEEASVEIAAFFADEPLEEPVPVSQLPPSYRAVLWEPPKEDFVAGLEELPGVREILLPTSEGLFDSTELLSTHYHIVIFFHSNASSSEIASVKSELAPIADDLVFVSQEQTYEEFLQLFSADEGLAEATTPSDMPPSFRANVETAIDAGVLDRVARMPGVRSVLPPTGNNPTL